VTSAALLPVVVELAPPLDGFLEHEEARDCQRMLALTLRKLARDLGVTITPTVEFAIGEPTRAVRIRLGERVLPYSPQLMRDIWTHAARDVELNGAEIPEPEDATNGDGSAAFPDGWIRRIASEIRGPHGRSRATVMASFVTHLSAALLADNPDALLGPGVVRRYLAEFGSERTEGPGSGALHAMTRDVLSFLLELGGSVGDQGTIVGTVLEGQREGRAVDGIAEGLYSLVRGSVVEIHLHERDLRELLGPAPTLDERQVGSPPPDEERPRRISVYDPRMTPKIREAARSLEEWFSGERGLLLPELELVVDGNAHPGTVAVQINDVLSAWVAHEGIDGIIGPVARQLLRQPHRLLSEEDVEFLLAELSEAYWAPTLIRSILGLLPLASVTRLLRGLLREGLSIRNLPAILNRALRYGEIPVDADVDDDEVVIFDDRLPVPSLDIGSTPPVERLIQFVRCASKGEVGRAYLAGHDGFTVLTVERTLDRLLRKTSLKVGGQIFNEREKERVRDTVWTSMARGVSRSKPAAVLASVGSRAVLRELLAPEFPDLAVLTASEIGPEVALDVVGEIQLPPRMQRPAPRGIRP
jgi:hypothetical protein